MSRTIPLPPSAIRTAPNLIDITGRTFGRLKVLGKAPSRVHGRAKVAYWRCRCRCGSLLEARGDKMRDGYVQSCGCAAPRTPKPKSTPVATMPAPTPPPPEPPVPHARPARTPRLISVEDRARMVNAFLVSGFTRRESEEMAGLGTVVAAKKPG